MIISILQFTNKPRSIIFCLLAFIAICFTPIESISKITNSNPTSSDKSGGIDWRNIDYSIRPQDDFYQYSNGQWLQKSKVPDDKFMIGVFMYVLG